MSLIISIKYTFIIFPAQGSQKERAIFAAMDEIESKSCVRFVPANQLDRKYVEFFSGIG